MFASAPAPSAVRVLASGDVSLHVEHFEAVGAPRLSVVMVHGLGLHCGLYRHVATALAERGVAVTQFDCRGHGRSGGPRGHVDAFADYLTDLHRVVELAQERFPGLRLALIGHSLGGLMVLSHALLARPAGLPARLVVAAPWLKLNVSVSRPRPDATEAFRRLRPTLAMDSLVRVEDLSRDPEVVAALASDPLVHHVVTARCFTCVLEQQAELAARLPIPGLFLIAGQDRIVSCEAAVTFARDAGCVPLVYPSARHGMFFEPEWQNMVRDMADWLLQSAF